MSLSSIHSATFNSALLRTINNNPGVYAGGRFGGGFRNGLISPNFNNAAPQGQGSAAAGTLGNFGIVNDNNDPNVQATNLRYTKKHLQNNHNLEQINTIGAGVQTGVSGLLGLATVLNAFGVMGNDTTNFAWLNTPSAAGTTIRGRAWGRGSPPQASYAQASSNRYLS